MNLQKINQAAEYIQSQTSLRPVVGIVLGSGLGPYADQIEDKVSIPYENIPHFHKTSVQGHEGKLIIGKIRGTVVAAFQGRFHAYEGHCQEGVVLPVRTLSRIGTKFVILTNASGGINSNYRPGELVCIEDHINLTGTNPLRGPNDERIGPRFPDMTYTYDPELKELFTQSANQLGIKLHHGVYAGLMGPTYETPAEIRMLRTLGADLVGMSTVPEAIAAHHAGLRVGAIACITNMAAGMIKEKLDHNDVKEVANKATAAFSSLLTASIEKLGKLK